MTTTSFDSASPVRLTAVDAAGQPAVTPALEELYRGFEDGEKSTPERSRAECLWGHPGLTPVAKAAKPSAPGSPLLAYRCEHTNQALADQLALEREGYPGTVEPGHAAVRYTDPVTGGSGTVTVGDATWSVGRGDLFVVPSWQPFSARSQAGGTDSDAGALDLFRFSDSPVFEALKLNRASADDAR